MGHTIEVYKALQPTSLPTIGERIRGLPGLKQLDQTAAAITHFTFGVVQRKFKVTDASLKYASWLAKHPESTPTEQLEARRLIAKEVNAAYGGLHWENLGVNRTTQQIARFLFLAPDWTFSNYLNLKYSGTGGPGGNAARLFWMRSIILGLALTAATSIMLARRRSQDPTQVLLGKDKNGKDLTDNVYFVGAPGDMSTLIHNVIRYGAILGGARSIANKLGPLPRAALHLASNKDALGREIVPKTTRTDLLGRSVGSHKPGFWEKTGLGAEQVVRDLAPVPFSVSTIMKMMTDRAHRYTAGQYAEALVSGRQPQAVNH
jgi:hypothetical protein